MFILRDTINGDCYVVGFDSPGELDLERIEAGGLELGGTVRNSTSVKIVDTEAEADGDDDPDQLYFTTCEHPGCGKWLLIIDDQAPEFCTEHEGAE